MGDNPLVSIIVPVYNVEEYLEECVNSIISQTYTNIEIILVDDGSTDNSGELCDKYSLRDNRIEVIHKVNGGISDARNVGAKSAKGKYIYFIDSDDYIVSEAIDELVSVALRDNSDIVFFDAKCFEEGEKGFNIPQRYIRKNNILVIYPLNKIKVILIKKAFFHKK